MDLSERQLSIARLRLFTNKELDREGFFEILGARSLIVRKIIKTLERALSRTAIPVLKTIIYGESCMKRMTGAPCFTKASGSSHFQALEKS